MIDNDFGHWVAGFVDGEGCFFMVPVNRPGGYRPGFALALRADDDAIVHEMKAVLEVGSIHYYTASGSGSRVVRWMVQSQRDCETLVQFFTRYPLRAKKRNDFEVWSRAVRAAADLRRGRANNEEAYANLRVLRDELRDGRKANLV